MIDVRRISFLGTPCFLAYASSLFLGSCMIWGISELKRTQVSEEINNSENLLKGNDIFRKSRQVDDDFAEHSALLYADLRYKRNVSGGESTSSASQVAGNVSENANSFGTETNLKNVTNLKNETNLRNETNTRDISIPTAKNDSVNILKNNLGGEIGLRTGNDLGNKNNTESSTVVINAKNESNPENKNSSGDKSNLGIKSRLGNESSLEGGNSPVNVPSGVSDSEGTSTSSKESESNSGGLNSSSVDSGLVVKDSQGGHNLNPKSNSETESVVEESASQNGNSSRNGSSAKNESLSNNETSTFKAGLRIDEGTIDEGTTIDESPTEKIPTEESPTEKSSTKESPTEESPTEKSPTEESSTKESSTNESSTEEGSTKDENLSEDENAIKNPPITENSPKDGTNAEIVKTGTISENVTIPTDESSMRKNNSPRIVSSLSRSFENTNVFLKLAQFLEGHKDLVLNSLANVIDAEMKKQRILDSMKEVFQNIFNKRNKRGVIEEFREKINEVLIGEEMKNDIREALADLVKTFEIDDDSNSETEPDKED